MTAQQTEILSENTRPRRSSVSSKVWTPEVEVVDRCSPLPKRHSSAACPHFWFRAPSCCVLPEGENVMGFSQGFTAVVLARPAYRVTTRIPGTLLDCTKREEAPWGWGGRVCTRRGEAFPRIPHDMDHTESTHFGVCTSRVLRIHRLERPVNFRRLLRPHTLHDLLGPGRRG